MADLSTAIVSGTFAVVGSLGSVWLKDYLERNRQRVAAQPTAEAPARSASLPKGYFQ
jgi:hypothetical protein